MNMFNRIVTSVTASVGKAVSQVENHEAVVDAALKETHSAAAKARVRHARVQKDGSALRKKLQELQQAEKIWVERARKVAAEDENKALQCVQRRNQCQAQIQQTQQVLHSHEQLETNINNSVQHIEKRVQELTQQRNMMRSRHSAADAMRVINQIENESGSYVDDALDRWEMVITETEYTNGTPLAVDNLDDSFTQIENQQALKADLDALLDIAGQQPKKQQS